MNQRVVVLGGGFAGLYSAYVTGGTLISEAPVAQGKKFSSNYIFLHSDNRVRMLLQDLDLPHATKSLSIGYYRGDEIHTEPTSQMVLDYVRKAYPDHDGPVSPFYFRDHLKVCDADYLALLSALEKQVKEVVFNKAVDIDLKRQLVMLDDGGAVPYEVLISTVPLVVFLKLANLSSMAEALRLRGHPLWFYPSDHDMQGYQIVLDANPGTPTLRWTRNNGTTMQECRADLARYGFNISPSLHLPHGKVFEDARTKDSKNFLLLILERFGVYMCGRFAQWKEHMDTEDIISRATEISMYIAGEVK